MVSEPDIEMLNDGSSSPRVTVIIVSYNTREMTLECLGKVEAAAAHVASEVIVVDNGSTDGSADAIAAQFPECRLIAGRENLGFGRANNLAMAEARGEYLVLLNSDAFVNDPTALRRMAEFMDSHPRVAVAGPLLRNADGSVQLSVHHLSTPRHVILRQAGFCRMRERLRPGSPEGDVAGLARRKCFLKGACLVVRRDAYRATGGFDERMFFYGEEAEWQYRLARQGYGLAFIRDVEVTHLGGASGADRRLDLTLMVFEGETYFVRKHFGRIAAAAVRGALGLWCLRKLLALCFRRTSDAKRFAWQLHVRLLKSLWQPTPLKV